MVKVILPEHQYPVCSIIGGGQSRNGPSQHGIFSSDLGEDNENKLIRCNNITIKGMSDEPKSKVDTIKTTVSTKGSNAHVGRGPVLTVLSGMGYASLKNVGNQPRGPAFLASRNMSTGPGRTTNVLKRLDSLRKRAQLEEIRIDRNLYIQFMLDPDMYLAAYQKLKSNPGMMTPGINPTTLDGMSLEKIHHIINQLRTGEFQFTPALGRPLIPIQGYVGRVVGLLYFFPKNTGRRRRIEIPKANGKRRPLTIGSPVDKLVQEVIRMVLEAIYEPIFKDSSHGFRPKRGCHTALREIFTKFVGCT